MALRHWIPVHPAFWMDEHAPVPPATQPTYTMSRRAFLKALGKGAAEAFALGVAYNGALKYPVNAVFGKDEKAEEGERFEINSGSTPGKGGYPIRDDIYSIDDVKSMTLRTVRQHGYAGVDVEVGITNTKTGKRLGGTITYPVEDWAATKAAIKAETGMAGEPSKADIEAHLKKYEMKLNLSERSGDRFHFNSTILREK